MRVRGRRRGWPGSGSVAELGDKVGTDSQRISRYENGRITPSLDAIVRIAEAFNVSIDYLLVDTVPRRRLHAAQDVFGDRLAAAAELAGDDLAALLNVLDGLVMKNRLKTLTAET